MSRILRFMRDAICEVLTFFLKTIPRFWREWQEFREEDHALAERLRRREYD